NEEVSGDSKQIAMEMEKLIMESLKWWHGYFGERDKLRLGDWKTERVEVIDGEVVETVVEIPVSRIMVPREGVPPIPETKLSKLSEVADLLPPVKVRLNESGYYELISGTILLTLYINHLGRDRVRAVVVEPGVDDSSRMGGDMDIALDKLLNMLA
ncbi:MAG: hypothetical protein QXV62_04435, partial [Nitrososphaerota archaeon]